MIWELFLCSLQPHTNMFGLLRKQLAHKCVDMQTEGSWCVQFLADLQFVFWEAAICSLQPWRRWYFSRFPFLSKQARNFVDSHNRCLACSRHSLGMHGELAWLDTSNSARAAAAAPCSPGGAGLATPPCSPNPVCKPSASLLACRVYEMWDHVWTKMEEAPEPSDKDLSLTACFRRLAASEDGKLQGL